MSKEKKSLKFYCTEKADVNETERSVISYVATRDIDRDNEIVLPEGIGLENYRKNPVVLWNHMSWGDNVTVIGKSLWQKIDSKGLLTKTEFAKTDLASEVYELVKEGFLTSWSIGFAVLDWEDNTGIRTYTKTELLEYSAVCVPANPEAVTLNFIKGLKTGEMKEAFSTKYLLASVDKEINELKELIAEIKSSQPVDLEMLIQAEIENKFKEYEPKFIELGNEIKSLKRAKTKREIEDLVFEAVKKKIG